MQKNARCVALALGAREIKAAFSQPFRHRYQANCGTLWWAQSKPVLCSARKVIELSWINFAYFHQPARELETVLPDS